MKNIPFNSKETYLAYRSAWKAEYKNLSLEIRTLRLAERFYQRQRSRLAPPANPQPAAPSADVPDEPQEFPMPAILTEGEERWLAAAQKLCVPALFGCNRLKRSNRATEMLSELKSAKLEAQRQYLARKAAEPNAN